MPLHVSFWQSDYGPVLVGLIAMPAFVVLLWLCDEIPARLRRRK